jgi:hypothetical protein
VHDHELGGWTFVWEDFNDECSVDVVTLKIEILMVILVTFARRRREKPRCCRKRRKRRAIISVFLL